MTGALPGDRYRCPACGLHSYRFGQGGPCPYCPQEKPDTRRTAGIGEIREVIADLLDHDRTTALVARLEPIVDLIEAEAYARGYQDGQENRP